MAIRHNIQVGLVELESAYGTDPTPTNADAVQFLTGQLTLNKEQNEKSGVTGTASRKESVGGATHWDITLEWANKGSGSAGTAPEFNDLLQAAGLKETVNAGTSVVYTPDMSEQKSCTLWWYQDGLLYKANGIRGNLSFQANAGEFGRWTFTGKGLYVAPSDAAVVSSPIYDSTKPVGMVNQTFTFDSYAAALRAFSFDLGLSAEALKAVGPSFGVSEISLDEFNVTGSMTVEQVLVATRAWEDNIADDEAGKALSFAMGAAAGNICTITSSGMKILGAQKQNNGGIVDLQANFELRESTSLADDVTVTYT